VFACFGAVRGAAYGGALNSQNTEVESIATERRYGLGYCWVSGFYSLVSWGDSPELPTEPCYDARG